MVTKVASIVVILTAVEEETKELHIRFANPCFLASNERMLIIGKRLKRFKAVDQTQI